MSDFYSHRLKQEAHIVKPTFSFLLQVALTLTEVIDIVKITFPNKKAQVSFLNIASVKIPWRQ